MKILYFDLIGGISGDMVVASLLDLSGEVKYLRKELKKIDIGPYALKFFWQKEGHIKMGRFLVCNTARQKKVYQFADIVKIVKKSRLSTKIKENIIRVYRALLRAEREVHRSCSTHFHQIGEIDSILDIASSCILIDRLKVKRMFYSSVPFGKKVAPATAQLLASKEIFFSRHPFENITPTGVAIITSLGKQTLKKRRKRFSIEGVGYGRGSFSSNGYANGLRAMLLRKKN